MFDRCKYYSRIYEQSHDASAVLISLNKDTDGLMLLNYAIKMQQKYCILYSLWKLVFPALYIQYCINL